LVVVVKNRAGMIWSVSMLVEAITTVFERTRCSGFHYKSSLGSAILPCTAVAAAVMGLTSKVRAPTP